MIRSATETQRLREVAQRVIRYVTERLEWDAKLAGYPPGGLDVSQDPETVDPVMDMIGGYMQISDKVGEENR